MKKHRNWIVLFIGVALMAGVADYFTQAKRATDELIVPTIISEESLHLFDDTLVNDADK
ncbi:hypothetical protein ACWHAM_19485 [Paenibacillus terrae]|uniref:Uncharacterized protein n=1 Tax=Paenibacillus terrae (strain HPL-003) TaxID=985665 RepID=G7W1P9_PAETH|nr:hypothetical protein [Paenibacillus terrae]AET58053.1 hypothetical protein HPL003_06450 [Paenibacillus terrae HPL-003]